MRRLSVLLVLGMAAFLLPAVSSAQEDVIWTLSESLDVTDLGFTLNYPEGWLFDDSNGITLAATEADMAAAVDNDPDTIAQGITLNVIGFPLTQLELEADTPLQEVVDLFAEGTGIEVQDQFELPVLARRSVSVIGPIPDGRAGVATLWLQDDGMLVIVALGAPDLDTLVAHAVTYRVFLDGFQPFGALGLTETLVVPELNIQFEYPDGWTRVEDNYVVLELADDLDTLISGEALPGGHVLLLSQYSLVDLAVEDASDPAAVQQGLIAIFPEAVETTTAELSLLTEVAAPFEVWIKLSDGRETFAAAWVEDEVLNVIYMGSPSAEDATAIRPTWFALLKTLRPLEAAQP